MKKFLIIIIALVLAAMPAGAGQIIVHLENSEYLDPPPDAVTAGAFIIMNAENGRLIAERNGSQIIYPGATVKIMTAILAVEHIRANNISLDSEYTASRNLAVINPPPGRRIGMRPGEVFTIEDLLNLLLVHGDNDSCVAFAEIISGSEAAFVARMNERARELGALNTVFTNSHGFHCPDMRTTALDTAKIALHASSLPLLMEISSAPSYELPPTNMTDNARTLVNRNHFVSRASVTRHFYEGARGMSVGSTAQSGQTLVTVASRPDNLSYLAVIMGATRTFSPAIDAYIVDSFGDARRLLDWAFAIYSYRTVLTTRHFWTEHVELAANNDTVTLVPEQEIRLLLPQNVSVEDEIERVVTLHETDASGRLVAPIEQGQVLGEVAIRHRGEIVARTNLLAASDVEPSEVLRILDQIRAVVARPWFTASVIIFIVLLAGYIALGLLRRNRRQRRISF